MPKHYDKLKKLEHKKNEIEFEAEVPVAVMEEYAALVLEARGRNFELPGFRKGKVPEHLLRQHFDEMDLWEDAAGEAIREALKDIIEDQKLTLLGSPRVTITKIVAKTPLAFRVRLALFPEVDLPDYKKIGSTIAGRKDSLEVTEAEMDTAINRIREMAAATTQAMQDKAAAPAHAAEGENPADKEPSAPGDSTPDKTLPELTDEFVAKLGPFKTVADFREEIKRQLGEEKELNAKHAKRDEIIREIATKARLEVPAMLIEEELEEVGRRRQAELEHAKMSFEDYLKRINKTAEELQKEEQAAVAEKLRTSLVLGEIRKKENIESDPQEAHMIFAQLKRRYPNQEERNLRQTATAFAAQEKLFAFLEGNSGKPPEEPVADQA